MSIVSGLLNQTIDSISSFTLDGYGDKSFKEIYTFVNCRWQERLQIIISDKGEEITSKVEVWMLSKYSDIKYGWKIVKDDETYMVVGKAIAYNLSGQPEYLKLYLA